MSGYIFYCSEQTEAECLKRSLVGAPQTSAAWAVAIRPGDTLFLYNYETGDIFGPLAAASTVDCYEPNAWGGRFPVQVRIAAAPVLKSNITPLRSSLLGSKATRPKHTLPDSLVSEVTNWLQNVGKTVQT